MKILPSYAARIASALSAGYIFMFFSERVFWSRLTADNTPADLLLTYLVYSILAFLFLWCIDYFRTRLWMTVLLCGAIFGWLAEGVIAHTLFENFPISISWTGLAWHALISVLFGWYGLRRAYLQAGVKEVALLAGGMGILWGLWGLWWPHELGSPIPLADFLLNTWLGSLLLVGAYAAYDAVQPTRFNPNRVETAVVGLAVFFWFAIVTVPAVGLRALLVPALIGLTMFGLWRARRSSAHASMLAVLRGTLRPATAAAILVMPLAASIIYAAGLSLQFFPPTNAIVLAIAAPVGFVLYGLSLVWAIRGTI